MTDQPKPIAPKPPAAPPTVTQRVLALFQGKDKAAAEKLLADFERQAATTTTPEAPAPAPTPAATVTAPTPPPTAPVAPPPPAETLPPAEKPVDETGDLKLDQLEDDEGEGEGDEGDLAKAEAKLTEMRASAESARLLADLMERKVRERQAKLDAQRATSQGGAKPGSKPITMGCRVRDRLTKFEGVVVAIKHMITGCTHYTLQPTELRSGLPAPASIIDSTHAIWIADPEPGVLPAPGAATGGDDLYEGANPGAGVVILSETIDVDSVNRW